MQQVERAVDPIPIIRAERAFDAMPRNRVTQFTNARRVQQLQVAAPVFNVPGSAQDVLAGAMNFGALEGA